MKLADCLTKFSASTRVFKHAQFNLNIGCKNSSKLLSDNPVFMFNALSASVALI